MIRKACIVVLLLGAVATGVLWVGSYTWGSPGEPLYTGEYQGWWVSTSSKLAPPYMMLCGDRGQFIVWRTWHCWAPSVSDCGPSHYEWSVGPCGVEYWAILGSGMPITKSLDIRGPFWPLFVALATYPSLAFIRGPVRRWRRQRKGLCVRCAYDLTLNESGVCPECGTAVNRES